MDHQINKIKIFYGYFDPKYDAFVRIGVAPVVLLQDEVNAFIKELRDFYVETHVTQLNQHVITNKDVPLMTVVVSYKESDNE